jgi:hypothetical protein
MGVGNISVRSARVSLQIQGDYDDAGQLARLRVENNGALVTLETQGSFCVTSFAKADSSPTLVQQIQATLLNDRRIEINVRDFGIETHCRRGCMTHFHRVTLEVSYSNAP